MKITLAIALSLFTLVACRQEEFSSTKDIKVDDPGNQTVFDARFYRIARRADLTYPQTKLSLEFRVSEGLGSKKGDYGMGFGIIENFSHSPVRDRMGRVQGAFVANGDLANVDREHADSYVALALGEPSFTASPGDGTSCHALASMPLYVDDTDVKVGLLDIQVFDTVPCNTVPRAVNGIARPVVCAGEFARVCDLTVFTGVDDRGGEVVKRFAFTLKE